MRLPAPQPAALSTGTRVCFIPAARAPHPAPNFLYTVTGPATPFTNVRPGCLVHPHGCPGPWYSLADTNGKALDDAICASLLETVE
jgi:hypothetical protein